MPRRLVRDPAVIRWWIAAIFVAFAMLFGGGSRSDVMSVIWLRPIAILMLAYALFGIKAADLRAHWFLVSVAAATALLTILHLVPLPPGLWRALPGRDLIVDIDTVIGIGEVWRPLSMVPTTTWNALYSLSVPLAVLFLLLPMSEEQLFNILKVIALVLLLSALVGLFQATGGSLSFYDIANPNAGLFANRNHQAVLLACLYPIAAVLASVPGLRNRQRKLRWIVAIILGLALAPLLMVTGSRAGIGVALIAIVSVPFIVPIAWRGDGTRRFPLRSLLMGALGLGLVVLLGWVAIQSDRNLAMLRFTELDATEDLRYPVWAVTWDLAIKYLPFGSGIGSFVEVFQIHEPDSLLMPRYWNHAHNDWLEVVLVAGLPGAALLVAAVAGYLLACLRAFTGGKSGSLANMLARLGCVILTILGLASVFDYPVRAPAVACVFVFAAVVAARGGKSRPARG